MKTHPAARPINPSDIPVFLETLANTPVRIDAATAGVADDLLCRRSAKRAWSAVDILAHLRACADVWGDSIQAMLSQVAPVLPEIGPHDYIMQTDYRTLEFQPSFQAFTHQRQMLLALLKPLPIRDWQRFADIGGRKHSVFSQVRRMAKHELEHCEQLEALKPLWISQQEEKR